MILNDLASRSKLPTVKKVFEKKNYKRGLLFCLLEIKLQVFLFNQDDNEIMSTILNIYIFFLNMYRIIILKKIIYI